MVNTEVEALQLEYSWIKEFDPRFNVKYRDDKSYPWLAVTVGDEFPRVMVGRGAKRKGTRYFGPYSHAWAIRETVDLLLRVFPMRSCSNGVFKRPGQIGRPCLLGYIGKCAAPCVGNVTAEEHREIVDDFCDFMAGHTAAFVRRIETRDVRRLRGRRTTSGRPGCATTSARSSKALEKQAVVLGDGTDADVIALAEDPLEVAVQIFYVRGGRIRGQRGWVADRVDEGDTAELVEDFLLQLYGGAGVGDTIPREVLVPRCRPTPRRGGAAQRPAGEPGADPGAAARRQADAAGDGRAQRRAVAGAAQDQARQRPHHPQPGARGDPGRRSSLDEVPLRIECYDISNLQGTEVVASMVVFEDGLARKSEYRRFVIKGVDGAERRRLHARGDHPAVPAAARRAGALHRGRDRVTGRCWSTPRPAGRASSPTRPGLVVVDGGPPQVAAARGPSTELGFDDIPVVRSGQAAGGGVAARPGGPGDPAAHLRGALPAPAGARRGPPVRDHPPPLAALEVDGREPARRRPRAGRGAAQDAAQALRLAARSCARRPSRRSPRCRASAPAPPRRSRMRWRGHGRPDCLRQHRHRRDRGDEP